MQTVNENIPVTKVVRVSELRTIDNISDDAMFICVQNGKSLKTTYGTLKNIIFKQVLNEVQQKLQYQAELDQAALSLTDEQLKANTNALSIAIAETMQKTNNATNAVETLTKCIDEADYKTQQQVISILENCQTMNDKIEHISANCSELSSNVIDKIKDNTKDFAKDFKQHKSDILQSINAKATEYKKLFKDISIKFEKNDIALSKFKSQIDEKNNVFNDKINEIRSELQKSSKEISSKFSQNDSKFSEIGSKLEEIDNKFAIINSKFTNVDNMFAKAAASTDSKFASEKTSFSSLEKQLSSFRKQLVLLENSMKALTEENKEFQKKVKDMIAYSDDAYCATVDEGAST